MFTSKEFLLEALLTGNLKYGYGPDRKMLSLDPCILQGIHSIKRIDGMTFSVGYKDNDGSFLINVRLLD